MLVAIDGTDDETLGGTVSRAYGQRFGARKMLNSMFIVPCACDVFIFTCNVTSVYPCSHCLCRLIRCHVITHLLPLSNNHAFRGVQ